MRDKSFKEPSIYVGVVSYGLYEEAERCILYAGLYLADAESAIKPFKVPEMIDGGQGSLEAYVERWHKGKLKSTKIIIERNL